MENNWSCHWRKAVEKIHEHAATEAHMISMVRWANYRKGPLVEAFKAQAAECELQNEKERQKNREILFRLIDITVYWQDKDWHLGDMMKAAPVLTEETSLSLCTS